MGGCGLDRACDNINHFGYHIKEIRPVKELGWGVAVPKDLEEKNTELDIPSSGVVSMA